MKYVHAELLFTIHMCCKTEWQLLRRYPEVTPRPASPKIPGSNASSKVCKPYRHHKALCREDLQVIRAWERYPEVNQVE